MSVITENERNEILFNMQSLLDDYNYSYTTSALVKSINKWEEEKGWLVEVMKKHPNYVDGKFMIVFDEDYKRECDEETAYEFCKWVKTQFQKFCWDKECPAWLSEEFQQKWKEESTRYVWWTENWWIHPDHIGCLTWEKWQATFVDKVLAECVTIRFPDIKAKEGMKCSRLMNKVCAHLGIDKHPEYQKRFAKYADAVNPLNIVRHTILSVNPIDYLTMSFGNSWASCHTIDKENLRGMPNHYEGQYSSGTISYMLDPSSIVFYTVDAQYEGNEYCFEPKINRQMFHFQHEKLIQARLYPQSNDSGADEKYTQIRNIVQKVIADCMNWPNLWTLERGTSSISNWVRDEGTHYRDYRHYSVCNISIKKENTDCNMVEIGRKPICIECGHSHEVEANINCCSGGYECESCGEYYSVNDMHEIGGYWYCENCCRFCAHCCEWELEDDVTYVAHVGYVCESCLDRYYTRCEHCDTYHLDSEYNTETVICENRWGRYTEEWCSHCRESDAIYCEECGEWFNFDDFSFVVHDDVYYCPDCAEEKGIVECQRCDTTFLVNQSVEEGVCTENGWLCNECYDELHPKLDAEEKKEEIA